MKLGAETVIHLNKFKPRPYQVPIIDALENKKYKKILAVMPRRCLDGSAFITMADGSWKYLKDIKEGDKILSFDGTSYVADTVVKTWCTGTKASVIVSNSFYIPLFSSWDHKFCTLVDIFSWKSPSEFSTSTKLLQYAHIPQGKEHNPELAEFIGYMQSDGYVCGYQQPKFTNNNLIILDRVSHLAQKLFNVTCIRRPKGNGFDVGFSNGIKGGGTFSNPIKELFRQVGQDIPKGRQRLHPMIWNMDALSVHSFLAALISGDGSISLSVSGKKSLLHGKTGGEIIIHCGSSKEYAYDIYWLLRKVNIIAQEPALDKSSNWKVRIGRTDSLRQLLKVLPVGKEDKAQELLKHIAHNEKKYRISHNSYTSRVKLIPSHDIEMYDIQTERNHNFIANGYVVHNSGKDLLAWNLMIRAALQTVGVYFYCLPTFRQAKLVIWDSITNTGVRFLDYIPPKLIESINSQEMKIRLINGSLIQLIGSDTYDTSLVGTNPRMIIFSEWALSDPAAYSYVRPILNANDGTVIFLSTPRGKNSLYQLYQIASNSPDWFCYKLTIEDTQHISIHEIEKEIASGEISRDLALQEYYCSFEMGVEGSYYAKYVDRMRLKGQIGDVPWESGFKVYTSWDLGVRDTTNIIFFQIIGQTVRIVDCYENSKEGLEHYVKVVQSKPYVYAKHIAPHDIKVREWGSGMSRIEKAKQLGISFTVAPDVSVVDGIEAVRSSLSRIWIDEKGCAQLLKAIENYRQEWDNKKQDYKPFPLHNWASHYADALRYLCISLPKTKDGISSQEREALYQQAMYGSNSQLPAPFRQPHEW